MIDKYSLLQCPGMEGIIDKLQEIVGGEGEPYLVSTDDKLADCNQIYASEYGETRNSYRTYCYPIVLVPHCGYSDYSGGSTERSNHRIMLEKYGDMRGITIITGSHGYCDLAVNHLLLVEEDGDLFDELIEDIASAVSYCVSEDDVSEYETQQESEDWGEYGKDDFIRSISSQFGQEFSDLLKESDENGKTSLASIYGVICSERSTYPYYEVSSTYFFFPDDLSIEDILNSEWCELEMTAHKYTYKEGEQYGEKKICLLTNPAFNNAQLVASQLGYEFSDDYSLVFSENANYFDLLSDDELIASFTWVNPDQLTLDIA